MVPDTHAEQHDAVAAAQLALAIVVAHREGLADVEVDLIRSAFDSVGAPLLVAALVSLTAQVLDDLSRRGITRADDHMAGLALHTAQLATLGIR